MITIMGRTGVTALIAVMLVLPVLAGCSAVPADPGAAQGSTASPTPEPRADPPTAVVPAVPVSDAGLGALAAAATVAPMRIALPDLGIDMEVEAEGIDQEGAMALPKNAATAGWYRFGPGLRESAGATVIAAHVDSPHDGIGPFSRLKDAAVGSLVNVTADDGSTVAYTVTEVRSVGKIGAPMAEVFDRAGSPRLTLVTCGGAFDYDTGHYVDNVIVTAIAVAL